MFIDTDEHGEQVQWKGPMDKENHTLLPTQPPHNQIYQQAGQTIRCLQTAISRSMSLADLPPIKSTRMPGR
ncbi:choline-sulfatase [Klebsiella pneumoniae]|uniref:Choline-sulfatase n=1 Tax=Klebsiella pneumoniae TaxID=573 RepID=A0A378AI40_KLEPN|nr:choline-sulfatase [Klebsiella pneumoniae]